MAETRKIAGLDLTRSLAMLLAMFAHALTVSGAREYVMEAATPVFVLIRLSTPIFIVLLGVILEIVYTRRLRQRFHLQQYQRLFERALLCWLLYALSNLPLLITGRMGLSYYVGTALLVGSSPFTDILRYYTIIFFLAPFLLIARLRVGNVVIMAVTAITLFAHSYVIQIPAPDAEYANGIVLRTSDLIFGIGDGATGPSVIHSLFFIATGMTLGSILRPTNPSEGQSPLSVKRLICLLAILAAGALLAATVGPEVVDIDGLVGKELRNANHPFYFFNGAFWACLFIAALSLIRYNAAGPFRLTMLGQRSLFTFAFGNAFLSLLLDRFAAPNAYGVLIAAGLVLAVVAFSAVYDIIITADLETSTNPLVKIGIKLRRTILDPSNRAISKLAKWTTRIVFGPHD